MTSRANEAAPARVHATLLAVQLAFASLSVEGKLAMGPRFGVAPPALAMARLLGAALAFGVAAAFVPGEPVRGVRQVGKLFGLALLGVVLNQVLFLEGLSRSSPLAATVLVGTIPVFASLAGALFGRERLGPSTLAGLALALLGMGVLTRFALPSTGDSLVLLNALSYATYVALAQPTVIRHGALRVMAWVFGLGALAFAPVGGPALVHGAASWPPSTFALVGFIVLVPTVLAYLGNAWALARATPSQVTIYVYLQPLVVAALAYAQLGQPVEPRLAAASVLILAGVAIVARRVGAPPKPR